MNKKQKTQQQIITTPVGNQYMATYVGAVGAAKYFECKKPGTDTVVGFAATVDNKNFGPVCRDFLVATVRARNIADASASWFSQLFVRQK